MKAYTKKTLTKEGLKAGYVQQASTSGQCFGDNQKRLNLWEDKDVYHVSLVSTEHKQSFIDAFNTLKDAREVFNNLLKTHNLKFCPNYSQE